MTPDPGFKVTVVLKGEYLVNNAFYRHIYYRMLTGNMCKLSNGVTFDALDPDFKLCASLLITAGLYCTM